MIYQIEQETERRIRGWFSLSLPIAGQTLNRLSFDMPDHMPPDVSEKLSELAWRASQDQLIQASRGEVLAAGILHSALRFVLGTFGHGNGLVVDTLAGSAHENWHQTYGAFDKAYPSAPGLNDKTRFFSEALLLCIARNNPALAEIGKLFGKDLTADEAHREFFQWVKGFGRSDSEETGDQSQSLYEILMKPIWEAPDDLSAQLRHLLTAWSSRLPDAFLLEIARGIDVLSEERQLRGGPGGPAAPLSFDPSSWGRPSEDITQARFTPDRDWMSEVVLIAKQTYVWLNQLSDIYQRPITRLDQIPDEELDRLAKLGFTGLWLIGIWTRSDASRAIKQRMGNQDAIASAYSLYDYQIADDLGGDAAYDNLNERTRARGLRLAADMVPNHVGLDGRWVLEHPEYFVQTDRPPYPNYQFNHENLSSDSRVGIYLEDGYFSQSDAAVVFKRVDHESGNVAYIYHGNDGTQMPWNDTAQLDYLNPEVREAVIQKILDVARRFSIIRFDAAMTLAKKHIQRLWYPAPGSGGAIPSRSEFGALSDEDFHRAIPEEFWREVVDRINTELPDTLLLAEAFWLMEGYFVRTLGMHRVYNSAFMNMLKREDNRGYRETMRNTLAFSPEVLKRFVNFMNNPDEETAVAQFGKGDKYLGNVILMVTLPGLPMFGHGQLEGFEEKYGMEYQRARWKEEPDQHLAWLQERFVSPLMRRRYLFAQTAAFQLYDFCSADGHIIEDVFAYSNREGDERALVLYNNAYGSASGSIGHSAPKNFGGIDTPELVSIDLFEGLELDSMSQFIVCRELMSGLEFVFDTQNVQSHSIRFELNGYETKVFLDFRSLSCSAQEGYELMQQGAGQGVASVENTLMRNRLREELDLFSHWVTPALVGEDSANAWQQLERSNAFGRVLAAPGIVKQLDQLKTRIFEKETLSVPLANERPVTATAKRTTGDELNDGVKNHSASDSGEAMATDRDTPSTESSEWHELSTRLCHAWTLAHLSPDVWATLETFGALSLETARAEVRMLASLLCVAADTPLTELLADAAVQAHLGVHTHDGVRWMTKEGIEMFWSAYLAVGQAVHQSERPGRSWPVIAETFGYRFDDFVNALTTETPLLCFTSTQSKK